MIEIPKKAVFLSYASQDSEAARRICESLRSAGVEVWFDVEGGLEHGDEWDAKIRRLIKECVLLIPIISASTQARHEGYFRIEWNLAAERAMGFASGVPFILPVVIDDTPQGGALVPEHFLKVQWTRIPGGVVTPEVLARFLKLWSHRTGVVSGEKAQPGISQIRADVPFPPEKKSRVPIAIGAAAAIAVASGAIWGLSRTGKTAVAPAPVVTPAPVAAAPVSPAGPMVAKVWDALNKADRGRGDLELADSLCKSATGLDPANAEAWAAWAQVDTWFGCLGLDNSPARREAARTHAAKALQLSPDSFEARLAQACYLVRGAGDPSVSLDAGAAQDALASLLKERAGEPRALLAEGVLLRNQAKLADSRAAFAEASKNPAFAAEALYETGWTDLATWDYASAEAAADKSIALLACSQNLGLKMLIALWWHGDMELAKDQLERIPAADRREDFAVTLACEFHLFQREPMRILTALDGVSADWFHSSYFEGPKGQWTGLAHALAGKPRMAQAQWGPALAVVQRRLAEQPNSGFLMKWEALLLAETMSRPEARRVLQQARDAAGAGASRNPVWDAEIQAAIGHLDYAVTVLEQKAGNGGLGMTAALCRLDPMLDPLRDQPRFKALMARLEADPRTSPNATPAGAKIK